MVAGKGPRPAEAPGMREIDESMELGLESSGEAVLDKMEEELPEMEKTIADLEQALEKVCPA